ncbi:MAG: polysaccharide deacetylase family protein [Planctomycetes bacterium]|nr:polysaccharide deacetylase family protein [Planctomycetota bacterium]
MKSVVLSLVAAIVWIAVVFVGSMSVVAQTPAEDAPPAAQPGGERLQLKTLPPAPKGGRFKMSYERVWPAEPGQAHVCLWADDKYAAVSVTIDDNCQPDHEWWIEQGKKYGFRFTWFVVTGGIGVKTNGFAGTWDDFRKLRELGHEVQSHTVSHHSDDGKRPDDEVRAQYVDSKKAIEENVPGAACTCLAYPYGSGKDEIASECYIACRGVVGGPDRANSINYMRTHVLGIRPDSVDMLLTGEHASTKWLTNPINRRAWGIGLYHYVRAGGTAEEKDANQARAAKDLAHLASKKDQIWIAPFGEVARFGMERDTAKLKVTKNTSDEIRLTLSDDMDDTIFTESLTVKIRLPEAWKTAAATQDGKPIEATIVEHDGGRFALVKAVPDKGEVCLAPSADNTAAGK